MPTRAAFQNRCYHEMIPAIKAAAPKPLLGFACPRLDTPAAEAALRRTETSKPIRPQVRRNPSSPHHHQHARFPKHIRRGPSRVSSLSTRELSPPSPPPTSTMHPRPSPSLLLGSLLLGAALPTALAHDPPQTPSTKTDFRFSSCVSNCVASSGCPDTSSATCICRPPLLSDAATCLFYFCPSSLRSFSTQFLDKIEDGCDAAGRAIPSKELEKLEKGAKALVAKLPTQTSTTSSAARTTTTKAVETTPPAVVPVPAPEPSTPATTFVQSASKTEAAPRRDPTDSSPFATVRKAEAAGGGWRATGWVVAPLVAAAMVL